MNAEDELQVVGFQYVIVRGDRHEDMLDTFKDHFFPDEPISHSLGLIMSDELREFMRVPLQQNLSIALVSSKTQEIIGGRIIKVNNREDKLAIGTFQSEGMKQFAYISTEADKRCNIFDYYNVDEVLYFYGLTVHRGYRRRGIGERLMRAALFFIRCLDLGTVIIKGGGTSTFSQRLFEKLGFEKLSEVVYSEFKLDGKVVITNSGEHKSEIRYGMSVN